MKTAEKVLHQSLSTPPAYTIYVDYFRESKFIGEYPACSDPYFDWLLCYADYKLMPTIETFTSLLPSDLVSVVALGIGKGMQLGIGFCSNEG